MSPLTSKERGVVNRAYHAFVSRGGVHDFYWVDAYRMPCVRKVGGRRRLLPPVGSVHVGRYDAAHTFHQLLADLIDTMRNA